MNEYYNNEPLVEGYYESKTNVAFAKSYLWMFLASLITLFSGFGFSYILKNYLNTSIGGVSIYLVLFIASFIIQMIMCMKINKASLVEANFTKAFVYIILSLHYIYVSFFFFLSNFSRCCIAYLLSCFHTLVWTNKGG